MCRKLALAATTLLSTALLLGGGPALAFGPFSKTKTDAGAATAVADSKSAASQPAASSKASADERAAAERMEPLGRAAFWASQVNTDPRDVDAGVKLASALRAIGRYEEAFAAAKQVLVLQPDNVEALLETARITIADNQGFFAIDPAKHAQALAPRDWRAPALLAVGLEQAKRPDEALIAHRQALALAPENPVVLSNAALFYAEQGDRPQAEVLLRKAAAQPGASVQVRQNLALILGLEGKLDEAERIQRQDLPPQIVDNNMAYLKAASENATTPAVR